ncbi:MAG: tyrosine-type recombinase/integrase [Proteobacteria bacterium]|nr:tyrosine-type recombinase/integrase [Pseudomonadota bacterium]
MPKNPNHPSKGSRITVEPIRDPKDIETIKRLLKNRPRDLLLFVMGINNGLRAGDLLKLKVSQVRQLKPGQSIAIREGKTGKTNILMMNRSSYRVLQRYLEQLQPADDAYLFKSNKGKNQPLTVSYVNNLVKAWCRSVNLKGNYGAHTLRKTFGYIQRTVYGVGFEVLAKRFNHSNPRITMRYLGITDAEVNGILLNEI